MIFSREKHKMVVVATGESRLGENYKDFIGRMRRLEAVKEAKNQGRNVRLHVAGNSSYSTVACYWVSAIDPEVNTEDMIE